MARIRYQVACSLDGYIAGPQSEYDWIPPEPTFDFEALHAQFDMILMGRQTYDIIHQNGDTFSDKRVVVVSKTLSQNKNSHLDSHIEIISENIKERVEVLRALSEKDIWLYGGGQLFNTLLDLDLVDTFEPAFIPILLGGGIPLHPPHGTRRSLTFKRQQVYPSGMVLMEYELQKNK